MVVQATSAVAAMDRIKRTAKELSEGGVEGFLPPTGSAVAEAAALILSVLERRGGSGQPEAVPWTSSPIPDGGLQVEWKGKTARIDVVIAPDGTISYMTKWGEGPRAKYTEEEGVDRSTVLTLIDRVLSS